MALGPAYGGAGLTAAQEALLDGALVFDDVVWAAGTAYPPNTLVRKVAAGTIYLQADTVDSTGDDPASGAPWAVWDSALWTALTGTAWRVAYTNGSGVVTELALGADGTYLRSNGAAAAPTFTAPATGAPQDSYFTREMFAGTSSVIFSGASMTTGTVASSTAFGASGLAGSVALSSIAVGGSGYRFQTIGAAFEACTGLLWTGRFMVPTNHTDKTFRYGFHDSSTTGAPTDGVYVESVAGTATVYSVSAGTPTASAGTFAVAADVWYNLSVYWTSTTSVVVSIRAMGGAMLDTRTITADLPSGTQQFGCGMQAWAPGGAASLLCHLDDMAYGIVSSHTP